MAVAAALFAASCTQRTMELCSAEATGAESFINGELIHLNDDGAWCWFSREQVLVHDGALIVGSIRGDAGDHAGNVELAVHDLTTRETSVAVLHHGFEADDHDVPGLLVRADGGLLALHTHHDSGSRIYHQSSAIGDATTWSAPAALAVPMPGPVDPVTYSNVLRLPSGRIVDFYRGYMLDPNWVYSDDDGRTWEIGGRWLNGGDKIRPYIKYAQDSRGGVHFVVTDDHPREYNNSIYHGVLRDDELYNSDGEGVAQLNQDLEVELQPADFTLVFEGDTDEVAWITDLELDRDGNPVVVFSVRKDAKGLDLRYYYARWTGEHWHWREIAYAGQRLYAAEETYAGLATLDPQDPGLVYISTDAHPATGAPLMSRADGCRHYELFRGHTPDGGETWDWDPITRDSTTDNLRPQIPRWDSPNTALVWMRGEYWDYAGGWNTEVVAIVIPRL